VRNFIGKLFGFDKEVEALYDLVRHKEVTIAALEDQRDEYKRLFFESSGISILKEQSVISSDKPTPNFEAISRGRSFNSIKKKLEQKITPVIVRETEQEIEKEVQKRASKIS